MKLIHVFTAIVALSSALPAHADLMCYGAAVDENSTLEVKTNADQTASASLAKDGNLVAKYSGTYVVTTVPQGLGPFKTLEFALQDSAGQAATFKVVFEKVWSMGDGFCGRGSCKPSKVTVITGVLTDSNLSQKFDCNEFAANN